MNIFQFNCNEHIDFHLLHKYNTLPLLTIAVLQPIFFDNYIVLSAKCIITYSNVFQLLVTWVISNSSIKFKRFKEEKGLKY